MVSGCDIKFLQTATHPLIHSSLAETAAPSRRCNPRAAEQKRRLPAAAATHAQRRQKRRLPAAAATHAQRRQKRRLPAACNPRAAAAETAAPSRLQPTRSGGRNGGSQPPLQPTRSGAETAAPSRLQPTRSGAAAWSRRMQAAGRGETSFALTRPGKRMLEVPEPCAETYVTPMVSARQQSVPAGSRHKLYG
jgi:hypothetical protein